MQLKKANEEICAAPGMIEYSKRNMEYLKKDIS